MTDQIDELSNNTLQSVAKKRAEQSKEAGGIGINNPTRAKAMSLLRKSDDAKYRHTEHPDKVTPKVAPPAPTEADKAAHAKANKAKVDSQNNRGYGEGRYMGDSVEQEEVVALDEHTVGSMVQVRLGGKWHQAQVTAGPHKESGHIEAKLKVGTKTIKTRFNPETEVKPVAEEVVALDELSMDTVKSYKEKVAKNPAPSKTTTNILHKAIRRFAGKERAEDRIHSDEMKKMHERLGLKNEEVKTEKPAHKVGDTVWATSPTNKALTMTGKVTKIGQTLTTVKHKDGSEAHYPHKLVNNEYSNLHTDPAKTYKQFQREHLEQTGELLTLTEVKYILENSDGGAGTIAQHAGVDGAAPQGTGKVKKMMGNKTDAATIAKIIVSGAKSKEERN
jgi:hypothetical protein